MKLAEITEILSPEWAALPDKTGFWTSQYGAQLNFESQIGGDLVLHFATDYPGLTFAWSQDGGPYQSIAMTAGTVKLALPAGRHHYCLVLQQWDTGQVDFWRTGVVLTDISYLGQLEPIIDQQPYVTFVGDSITAGERMADMDHHPEVSFPQLVVTQLGRPLARIAYGGTGLTPHAPFQEPNAIEALWKVAEDLPRPRVATDLVVVNYGLNDKNYGASDQEFAFALRVYLLELIKRFHQARFILLVPINGAFREIFEQETARFDCFTVVDTSDWGLYTRGRHPNIAEHQRAAEKILELLEV